MLLDKYDDNPDIDAALRQYHKGLKFFERDALYGDVTHKTTFKAGCPKAMHGVLDNQTLLTGKRIAG